MLSWEYLAEVLREMGYGRKLIGGMEQCCMNQRIIVLSNGAIAGSFLIGRVGN